MAVDFRKDGVAKDAVKYGKHVGKSGKPVSVVQDLNMVAIAHDSARWEKDGELKLVYVQFLIHPDDPTAANQTSMSLMAHDRVYQGKTQTEFTVALTPGQFDQLVAAAGDNTTPKLDKAGKPIGVVYGVKGSVFQKSDKDPKTGQMDLNKPHGYMPITSTLVTSDFPVAATGKGTTAKADAVTRSFELGAANRAASAAEREAAGRQTEAEPVIKEAEPELV